MVAVQLNLDELLHVAAGRALVPQPPLAAHVDAGAGAQRLGHALRAAVDESEGDAALVGDDRGDERVGPVTGGIGEHERGGADEARLVGGVDRQLRGRHNGRGVDARQLDGVFLAGAGERDVDGRSLAAVLLQQTLDEKGILDAVQVDADGRVLENVQLLIRLAGERQHDSAQVEVVGRLERQQLLARHKHFCRAGVE